MLSCSFSNLARFPLSLVLICTGCSNASTSPSADGGGAQDGGGAADGAVPTDAAGVPADAGAADAGAAEGGTPTCAAKDAPLPTTQLTVDGTTYYLVLQTTLPSTVVHNVQLNFGTETQFRKCPEEPGQNSTLALQVTFKQKPTASGSFNFTDAQPQTADQLKLYMSFFLNTGSPRVGKNYLSPNTGAHAVTIAGGKMQTSFANLTVTDQSNAAQSLTFSATIDIPW